MSGFKVAVVGGDERQRYLADMLGASGFDVKALCLGAGDVSRQALAECQAAILPMPATDGAGRIRTPLWEGELTAEQAFSLLGGDTTVFAGKVGEDLTRPAGQFGLTLVDYLEREELAVLNAVPTAEGAVAIAMARREETLFGAHVLVTGMGRIARMLLKLLVAFGAKVTVAARKPPDRVWADCGGALHSIPFEDVEGAAAQFDIVFNTVPHLVVDDAILAQVRPDCLIIDLASKPGGVDFLAAARRGIEAEWALALPGKVAPKTAARAIHTTILNLLDEMKML